VGSIRNLGAAVAVAGSLATGGVALAAGAVSAGTSAGAVSRSCSPRAETIATPSARSAYLEGVAAAPNGDVWAVGETGPGDSERTVIVRWDGRRAGRVPSPSNSGALALNELRAVTAPAADSAWAVGTDLVLHWDGVRWRRTPAPAGSYWAVSSAGRNDVWAVGTRDEGGLLVSHWDGSKWRAVPFLPVPAQSTTTSPGHTTILFGFLEGVLALAADDVWVVGTTGAAAVVGHWNGSGWRSYSLPHLGVGIDADFGSLAALSPHDVWAAGGLRGSAGSVAQWRGDHWQIRSRWSESAKYYYSDVTVRRGELWAIVDDLSAWTLSRWSGTAWTPLERLNSNIAISGLAADPAGDIWAVGWHLGDHARQRGLIQRYRCSR
jgi:hypothetical protein